MKSLKIWNNFLQKTFVFLFIPEYIDAAPQARLKRDSKVEYVEESLTLSESSENTKQSSEYGIVPV